jgi:TRAP-type C4-dicarboxylate transport system permease small subunit
MAPPEDDRPSGAGAARAIGESIVERVCKYICIAAIAVMLIVIAVDIVTRSLFNFSFEISDELGGYLLAAITFISLPVCQANDSFHHVELVQARLSPRGRAVSHLIFDVLSLAFCGLLTWQLARFEIASWRFDDHAPTYLATPLWLPRAAMVFGTAALCVTVLRTLLVDIKRLRDAGAGREPT